MNNQPPSNVRSVNWQMAGWLFGWAASFFWGLVEMIKWVR